MFLSDYPTHEIIKSGEDGTGNSYSSTKCCFYFLSFSEFYSLFVGSHKACLLAVGHCHASCLLMLALNCQHQNLPTPTPIPVAHLAFIKFGLVTIEIDDFVVLTIAAGTFSLIVIKGDLIIVEIDGVDSIIVDSSNVGEIVLVVQIDELDFRSVKVGTIISDGYDIMTIKMIDIDAIAVRIVQL